MNGINKKHSSGVAIVTTIFILIFVSIIAGSLIKNQSLDIYRVSNMFERIQAYHYALVGESQAKQMLYANMADSAEIDHVSEEWYGLHNGARVDNGNIEFYIEDLHSKFNINSLSGIGEFTEENITAFKKIVNKLNINSHATEILLDWLDEDNNLRLNGAEDREYIINQNPPFYRVGNGLMADISEVKLLVGIDNNVFKKLEPYIVALPEFNTKINVNTVSDNMLRIIIGDEAEKLISARNIKGFINLEELKMLTANSSIFDVKSNYYMVYSKASFGNSQVYLSSVVYCQKKKDNSAEIKVLYRNLSKKFIFESGGIKMLKL